MSGENGNGQKQKTFHEWVAMLRDKIDANRDKIFSGAAAGVDQDQYIGLFFQAIGRNDTLRLCTLSSLIVALTDSAVLGLPINGVGGDGYMVPRSRSVKKGNGWEKIWEAHFQAGYLGVLKLAYESPMVDMIACEIVREGDVYEVSLGSEQTIKHIPRGGTIITNCYAVIWHTSGRCRCVDWTLQQVQDHRNQYAPPPKEGKDKSAWATNFAGMMKKTVLRSLLKFAPMSDRARRVMQVDEYEEAGVRAGLATLQSGDTLPTEDLDNLLDEPDGDWHPTAEEAAADEARLQREGTVR